MKAKGRRVRIWIRALPLSLRILHFPLLFFAAAQAPLNAAELWIEPQIKPLGMAEFECCRHLGVYHDSWVDWTPIPNGVDTVIRLPQGYECGVQLGTWNEVYVNASGSLSFGGWNNYAGPAYSLDGWSAQDARDTTWRYWPDDLGGSPGALILPMQRLTAEGLPLGTDFDIAAALFPAGLDTLSGQEMQPYLAFDITQHHSAGDINSMYLFGFDNTGFVGVNAAQKHLSGGEDWAWQWNSMVGGQQFAANIPSWYCDFPSLISPNYFWKFCGARGEWPGSSEGPPPQELCELPPLNEATGIPVGASARPDRAVMPQFPDEHEFWTWDVVDGEGVYVQAFPLATPEPAGAVLLLCGVPLLWWARRRRGGDGELS